MFDPCGPCAQGANYAIFSVRNVLIDFIQPALHYIRDESVIFSTYPISKATKGQLLAVGFKIHEPTMFATKQRKSIFENDLRTKIGNNIFVPKKNLYIWLLFFILFL